MPIFYNVQSTEQKKKHVKMWEEKNTRRIKRVDAIKLIEMGILANSRIKRKEQSDKQFEYTKERRKTNRKKRKK